MFTDDSTFEDFKPYLKEYEYLKDIGQTKIANRIRNFDFGTFIVYIKGLDYGDVEYMYYNFKEEIIDYFLEEMNYETETTYTSLLKKENYSVIVIEWEEVCG